MMRAKSLKDRPVASNTSARLEVEGQRPSPCRPPRFERLKVVGSSPALRASADEVRPRSRGDDVEGAPENRQLAVA